MIAHRGLFRLPCNRGAVMPDSARLCLHTSNASRTWVISDSGVVNVLRMPWGSSHALNWRSCFTLSWTSVIKLGLASPRLTASTTRYSSRRSSGHAYFSSTRKARISMPLSFASSHSSQVMLFRSEFGWSRGTQP